jgi:hypothetical protein
MREDAAEQYLSYKLIDSNQDCKAKWFYVTNHHPALPKPSGKQPKHRPWWNSEPIMQEGLQLPELLARIKCHTRFPEGNQMHLICVPGSSSTHMIDEMSVRS